MSLQDEQNHAQAAAVRRTVGIAALRRLRQMVDADQADSAARQRRAKLLLGWIVLFAALGLAFLLRGHIGA